MSITDKKKIVVFGSLNLGIGDYIAHLYPHLSKYSNVEVLSFSHMAFGDPVTPQESQLVFTHIPDPKLLVRPDTFRTLAESSVRMSDQLERFEPDAFNIQVSAFVHVLHYFFYEQISRLKQRGVKIIYTVHDVLHTGEENMVNNAILQDFYHLADVLFVGNEREKNYLEQTFSMKSPIIIGSHGVYDLFNKDIVDVASARKRLGLAPEDFVILFFGVIRDNKGIDTLIRSFSQVIAKREKITHPIKLYIAGSTRNDTALKEKYEELIKSLDLSEKVTLHIKKRDLFGLEEIETVFKAASAVCLPYTHSSQSGVLNLAVGFKKPVIITDAFFEAQEVKDKLGIVVPMAKEKELAEAISHMAKNYSYYVDLFAKHFSEYSQQHSWEKLAKQMLEEVTKKE